MLLNIQITSVLELVSVRIDKHHTVSSFKADKMLMIAIYTSIEQRLDTSRQLISCFL